MNRVLKNECAVAQTHEQRRSTAIIGEDHFIDEVLLVTPFQVILYVLFPHALIPIS
jgi:hypothetical protein